MSSAAEQGLPLPGRGVEADELPVVRKEDSGRLRARLGAPRLPPPPPPEGRREPVRDVLDGSGGEVDGFDRVGRLPGSRLVSRDAHEDPAVRRLAREADAPDRSERDPPREDA